jgi:hypothetical protein
MEIHLARLLVAVDLWTFQRFVFGWSILRH